MGKKKKKVIPKPNYGAYINSSAWLKKRIQAYWCLGKVCELCGSNKKIQVHHNNYSALGSEKIFRDLVILCESCHKAFHKAIPSQELGKKRVGYTKKCSLCMTNTHKQTKYLSCSTSRRTKEQKERKKRTLRVCRVCVESLTGRLLSENKISNIKQKPPQSAKKKEKAKLLPPKASKPTKVKKLKKPPPPVGSPEVVVLRRSSRKTT